MSTLNETAVSFYYITIALQASYDSNARLLTEIITLKTHLVLKKKTKQNIKIKIYFNILS